MIFTLPALSNGSMRARKVADELPEQWPSTSPRSSASKASCELL